MVKGLQNFLIAVVSAAVRRRVFVVLAFAALCGGALWLIASQLGMNTDTEDMLSEELPWRRAYIDYKNEFPQYVDTLVAVIDAPTPDQADSAAAALTAELAPQTKLFEEVIYLPGLDFFRQNQFLYLEPGELEDLADQLAAAQPFIARLRDGASAEQLFSVLAQAVDAVADGEDISLGASLSATADTLEALLEGAPRRMSWQTLIAGEQRGSTRAFVQIKPVLDYSQLTPGEEAIDVIRHTVEALGLTADRGYSTRLTGTVALATEEMHSVTRGAARAGTAALVMVVVCLLLGLGSVQLAMIIAVVLIVGLTLTAGFAAGAIGELNLISVAFAVLYLGLGVDFAIHICLRFRETLAYAPAKPALVSATSHVGESLVLCALTTAIGFFAFVPTPYTGIAELGIIAGTGMFIGLLVSLTLLPALLSLLPFSPNHLAPNSASGVPRLARLPVTFARPTLVVAAVLAAAATVSLRGLEFDLNPLNLHDRTTESVRTFEELLESKDDSPLTVIVVVDDAAEARRVTARLAASPATSRVLSALEFVPDAQARKLAVVDDLNFILGPDLEDGTAVLESSTPAGLERRIAELRTSLARPGAGSIAGSDELDAVLERLQGALGDRERIDSGLIERLDEALIGNFPAQIARLSAALEAAPIALESLPEVVRERWISERGRFRIEAFPAEPLGTNGQTVRFVSDMRELAGDGIVGLPVINVEAADAVVAAFRQAFVSAFLAIALVLFAILRRIRDVLLSLVPLTLAGLYTCGIAATFGIPFNFANIIALPLLLGIGVDSTLHILHRHRTETRDTGNLLNTSTARAVVFSALTTICSFGNLAISEHAGTASLGLMLSIGVFITLICTLVVLPSILTVLSGQSGNVPASAGD